MTVELKKQTKAAKVLDSLRHDIISGHFQPGQKLQMDDLKSQYNVGYSPLREALSRLVSHGLVCMKEQCGFSVAPLSLEELYDLYMVRIRIEIQALELSIQNGDDDWEANVTATWFKYKKYLNHGKNNQVDPANWDKLQKEFRFALIKSCQSNWLLKIRDMLNDQALRYRFICLNSYYQNKEVLNTFIKENEALVSAVLSRDIKTAVKITQTSWESSVKLIANAMQKNMTTK
jgi:GntR family carbon starvation induced transcriptional regulator